MSPIALRGVVSPPLFAGQLIDQPKKTGALFDVFHADVRVRWFFGRRFSLLARCALPTIRNGVGCDPQKPRGKRNSAPLIAAQICERRMEHFGSHVLGRIAASDALGDVCIDALEIVFVKLGKAGGILLRGLDKLPLARFPLHSLQRRLRIICS